VLVGHWKPNASVCHTYDLSKGHMGVLPGVAHGASPIDISAAWHTFSVDWNATAITFAVDGKAIGDQRTRARTCTAKRLCCAAAPA
jgi:beta-glucanase (GH16 family)